jgi:hypothetical protein
MNSSTARWLEFDALRGFAVVGIFWVNIIYFGWPYGAIPYPILFGGIPELNILSWGFIHLRVEGAMFALFSMLFGASALILLGEQRLAGLHKLHHPDPVCYYCVLRLRLGPVREVNLLSTDHDRYAIWGYADTAQCLLVKIFPSRAVGMAVAFFGAPEAAAFP